MTWSSSRRQTWLEAMVLAAVDHGSRNLLTKSAACAFEVHGTTSQERKLHQQAARRALFKRMSAEQLAIAMTQDGLLQPLEGSEYGGRECELVDASGFSEHGGLGRMTVSSEGKVPGSDISLRTVCYRLFSLSGQVQLRLRQHAVSHAKLLPVTKHLDGQRT